MSDLLTAIARAVAAEAIRREGAHAHLPVSEDADGLTCDICGAELADWAAADHHIDKEHPS